MDYYRLINSGGTLPHTTEALVIGMEFGERCELQPLIVIELFLCKQSINGGHSLPHHHIELNLTPSDHAATISICW